MPLPIPYHKSQEVIDSTKISCFQRCPRKFFYEYLLGWRPSIPSNHLIYGKALHEALEHLTNTDYSASRVLEAIDIFIESYRKTFPAGTDEMFFPKTPERFALMLAEYVRVYREDPNRYTLVKAEFGGTIPLSPKHALAFKIDTVYKDNSSERYFALEHKTAQLSSLSPYYSIQHEVGTQIGTYNHVLNCMFSPENVDGIIINLIGFKKVIKPRADNSMFILSRIPIFLSMSQMQTWLDTTLYYMDEIERNKSILMTENDSTHSMKSFPRRPVACTDFARPCTYYDLCKFYPNPLKALNKMPAEFEISFWNPLEEDLKETLTFSLD